MDSPPVEAEPTTDISATAKAAAGTSSSSDTSDTSTSKKPEETATAAGKLPDERPEGVPVDPWTAFATTPEQQPGRIRRGLRAVGRALIHEYALVTYAGAVLAVLMSWPALRYPLHTLPQDLGDPARQAWQISWLGHVLRTDPVLLWQSNAYYPVTDSSAYGDSLLGYALFGMIGDGPDAAVLRYNILYVVAHALLLIGGYALVRQLGARRTGAAVAAAAFAYAPWRLAQEGHLDIVSAGAIPLALAMLARGHGWSLRYGFRPRRRRTGWAVLGWLLATWQLSLGFSLGLPFAYVLAGILVFLLIAVPIKRFRRRRRRRERERGAPARHSAGGRRWFARRTTRVKPVLGWRLITADVLGALIFAGVGAVIAIPYLRVPDSATRGTETDFFSPPVRSLLIGPAESRIWGSAHETARTSLGWAAEQSLLPGFVLYALALAGLLFSIWRLRQRLVLLLGLAAAVILTLGTTFAGGRWTYLPLFGHLPASFDLRISGRLMLWVTLLLAILAAGAVDDFVGRAWRLAEQRVPPWPGPWLRMATLVPLLLVLLEGWSATAHPVVPTQPEAMRTVGGPMLVLPTGSLTDPVVQLWSTSTYPQVANGGGTVAEARQAELRSKVASFPDTASIEYLRSVGIGTVLLLRTEVAGTPWERAGDIPVDLLGIRREDLTDAVVFHLN
ncbi:hypothetical protein [Actinoplanes sp. NPDC051851]|uniref:hypothetical protein n=1 Tax=Actinoplanes sp. NPDC051851 TaxID=3154753 RepID=UPI0034141585